MATDLWECAFEDNMVGPGGLRNPLERFWSRHRVSRQDVTFATDADDDCRCFAGQWRHGGAEPSRTNDRCQRALQSGGGGPGTDAGLAFCSSQNKSHAKPNLNIIRKPQSFGLTPRANKKRALAMLSQHTRMPSSPARRTSRIQECVDQ